MTSKLCSLKCSDKPLPLSAFNRKGDDKYQPYCRDCQRIKAREYYVKNREKHTKATTERNRRHRTAMREAMRDYLLNHPCVGCVNEDIRVLEFDHVRGEKSGNVSTMMKDARAWAVVLKEIEKCDVVCANCHKIRTYSRMAKCYRQ